MDSSSDTSSDNESLHIPLYRRETSSSSVESSSEESLINCPLNSGQNVTTKRRYESPSEEDASEDDSPPLPRPSKVLKQSNGGPSENDSSVNAMKAKPFTAQNCRHCCSICDEEYNRTMRRPLCLPCGHTFCSACLKGVENAGSRLCPVCRGYFGNETIAQMAPCYQLIPGNDPATVKPPVNVVQQTQKLGEGTVWNVKNLNQLLKVEYALTSSSVRPKEVAISVDGAFGLPLPQMKLFLDLLRRTRCAVSAVLLDGFLEPNKLHQGRDEQLLKGLLNGRCRVVKFCGYLSRNILKLLESIQTLETLGFGLTDANDVKALIGAMDNRFMDYVEIMHVSISRRLNLNYITKKILVSPNMRCVVHFCDVDDEGVKEIPKALDALFSTDSFLELQLHSCLFSMRGADTLLGVIRDMGMRRVEVESLCLKPEEKKIMSSRCLKFNCQITWTPEAIMLS